MNVRILFVEDSADDADLMLRRLREADIEPLWDRVDSEAALREALAGEPREVALVDFNLPGFGGLEALALLAELAPDLPAITVSGAISEEMAVATISAGAVDYVLKDNLTRLAPAVRRAVESAELRRQERRAAEQARGTQFAIDHSSQTIAYVGRDGTILYANAAAGRLSEAAPEDIIGSSIHSWSPLLDEERWLDLWASAVQHPPVQFETTIMTAEGRERPVSITLDSSGAESGPFVIVYARDISERKQTEEALRRSEAQLRTLIDTLPDLVWLKDPEGVYLSCNRRFASFFGAPEKDIVGKTDNDFMDADLADFFRQHDRAAAAAGIPTANEEEIVFADDGHREVLETIKTPVVAGDGRLIGVLGVGRDITARKQAEEGLKQSEARLAAAQAVAKVGSWETDLLSLEVIWSDETYRIFAIDRAGYGSTHPDFLTFVHPGDRVKVDAAFAASFDSRSPNAIEHRIVTPGGLVKDVEERWWIVEDDQGQPVRALGTCQDITERKHAEEALRQSEERFRRVSAATSDFAYSCVKPPGGSFAFDWLSGAVERITGWSREELLEWGCWKALVLEEDVPLFEERVTGLAPGESSVCELRVRDKQGRVRWLAAYSAVEQNADDPAVHLLHGACQDITARKQAEQEVRRQAQQLKRTVEGAVLAMGHVVESRDPYTAGHERRVSELATAIAADMGMEGEALAALRLAALIHDVGKIAVPAEILAKPGLLSEVEFSLIKQHPQSGFEILEAIDFGLPVAEMVLQHHERLDGSGYPWGLSGDDVSREARILAVADVVEAMSSHRPYRAALGMAAALTEVREHAGVKYDAAVVATCVRLVEERGFAFAE